MAYPKNDFRDRNLTEREIDEFESMFCDPRRRPMLWALAEKEIPDFARRSAAEAEILMCSRLVMEAMEFRNRTLEAKRPNALTIQALASRFDIDIRLFYRHSVSGDREVLNKLRRALTALFRRNSPTDTVAPGIVDLADEPDPTLRAITRVDRFFFRPLPEPGRIESPYFAASIRDRSHPVNYYEALSVYYRVRARLRLAKACAERVPRVPTCASIHLVSGFHGFSAGSNSEIARAFVRAFRECAAEGARVTVIVPEPSEAQRGDFLPPCIKTALRIVDGAIPTDLVSAPGSIRIATLDPTLVVVDGRRRRFAGEYLQHMFRYAHYEVQGSTANNESDAWHEMLVMRPNLEHDLLAASIRPTDREEKWFCEWLRAFEPHLRDLEIRRDPTATTGAAPTTEADVADLGA